MRDDLKVPVDHTPQPAPFTLTSTPGSLVMKAAGGKGPTYVDPVDRKPAERWSTWSRGRMVKRLASLDYSPLYADYLSSPLMVTLTMPGEWEHLVPTPQDFQAMVKRFIRRLAYALSGTSTVPHIWKLEHQRRNAPHLHLLVSLPKKIKGEPVTQWVSRTWYEAVGSGDPAHLKAGTGIDWSESELLTDAMRMATYFSRHANAGQSKGFQNEVPAIWKGQSYRFWGYAGLKPDETLHALERQQAYEAMRLLRAHYRATHPPVIKSRDRFVFFPEPTEDDNAAGRFERHQGRLFERKVKRGASPTTGELRFRYVYRRPHSHSLQGDHRGKGGFVLAPGAPVLSAGVLESIAVPAVLSTADRLERLARVHRGGVSMRAMFLGHWVAAHPETPVHVLRTMEHDPDSRVRSLAAATLAARPLSFGDPRDVLSFVSDALAAPEGPCPALVKSENHVELFGADNGGTTATPVSEFL
jgi:hypothetical protein